jgi:hypothetical protein
MTTKMVTQKDYQGNKEKLPADVYTQHLKCKKCGETRYYKQADAFQVKPAGLCKPCIAEERRSRRRKARAKVKPAKPAKKVEPKKAAPKAAPKKAATKAAEPKKRGRPKKVKEEVTLPIPEGRTTPIPTKDFKQAEPAPKVEPKKEEPVKEVVKRESTEIVEGPMPDNRDYTNRFGIKSESSDKIYVVSQDKRTGEWKCSCRGWIHHRKCKHLASLRDLIASKEEHKKIEE